MAFLGCFFSSQHGHNQSCLRQSSLEQTNIGDIEDEEPLLLLSSSHQLPNYELEDEGNAVFSSNICSLHLQQNQNSDLSCTSCACYCGNNSMNEKPSIYILYVCIIGILLVSSTSIGLGYYSMFMLKPEPVIDKSIDSFNIPNHIAYIHFEEFSLARHYYFANRLKRDLQLQNSKSPLHDLLPSSIENKPDGRIALNNLLKSKVRRSVHLDEYRYQVFNRWKMYLIYLAHGDEDHNMFTEERLKTVHNIEQKIASHPHWSEFCLRDPHSAIQDPVVGSHNGCAPLNSLMTYFFPSQDKHGHIHFDGFGDKLGDVESALRLAMNQETFYYFVDEKINKTYLKSNMLRTEVLFGAPLPGFHGLGDQFDRQVDKYKDFVVSYIDILKNASTDKVLVLYGGNELFDYEVEAIFWSDVGLAVFALFAVLLVMIVMTSFSLSLTFMGIWCIALSFPLAMFFYRAVFKIVGLGIMNGAAAFVIIGIGVDDVFVFINIFQQSSPTGSINKRLLHTIRTAGISTFATSMTTAVSFSANIASCVPAVYEFGLFMSLIVTACWLIVFLIMPATLYIHAHTVVRCLRISLISKMWNLFSCHRIKFSSLVARNVGDISTDVLDDVRGSISRNVVQGDVRLVDLATYDLSTDRSFTADAVDDPMLPVGDGPRLRTHLFSASPVARLQQYVLCFLAKRFIIDRRAAWIVMHALLLVASLGMMSQLRTATRPPQLFEAQTNLQRLLELKANFTMIDMLHCDQCSALYKLKQRKDLSANNLPSMSANHLKSMDAMLHYGTNVENSSAYALSRHDLSSSTSAANGTQKTTSDHWFLPWFMKRILTASNLMFSDADNINSPDSPPVPSSFVSDAIFATNITRSSLTLIKNNTIENENEKNSSHHIRHLSTRSIAEGYNVCQHQDCNSIKSRPQIQSGVIVYVVFGISGINRTGVHPGHVLTDFRGYPLFDQRFADEVGDPTDLSRDHFRDLCRICKELSENRLLVKNGTSQCLSHGLPFTLMVMLNSIEECKSLPKVSSLSEHHEAAHAEAGTRNGKIIWLAFAFESTVSKGEGYFEAYQVYLLWERFIDHVKNNILNDQSPLQSIFQTSDHWSRVMMEVVAVNNAVYGVIFSMVVCACSIAIFTGHLLMLAVVSVTISGSICLVVAVFYLVGWQVGVVEAMSLSILVGSSVDYCLHLAEGYLLMGRQAPAASLEDSGAMRRWRTLASVRHIGASIVSSALTTIVAAIPLTQTTFQPFAKFGKIVLINTTVSIFFSLTLCVPVLTVVAPAHFTPTWRSHLKASFAVLTACGCTTLLLYALSSTGVFQLPGPNGAPLF